jgi:hypothetical protein
MFWIHISAMENVVEIVIVALALAGSWIGWLVIRVKLANLNRN